MRYDGWLFTAALWLAAVRAAVALEPTPQSFDARVPHAPTPYVVDGHPTLVYELHLHNHASASVLPTAISVLDPDRGAVLARYTGADLMRRLDLSGVQRSTTAGEGILPGGHGVLFVELSLMPEQTPPASLRHRIAYREAVPVAMLQNMEGADVALQARPVAVLGPPLRGGPWVAVYDYSWERGHRRVSFAIDGAARTPGRHAADWVRVDAQGRKQAGEGDLAARTFSHGEDVLAVADGTVVALRDGLPERERLSESAQHDLDTSSGNFVALDIGGGRFAYYGHLRPGSLRVRIGQRVAKGALLAQVGFSGSASDPQLHFHLGDAPDAHAAEGLPFVFERFELRGRYAEIADLGRERWIPHAGVEARIHEMPPGNSVIDFNDTSASAGSHRGE